MRMGSSHRVSRRIFGGSVPGQGGRSRQRRTQVQTRQRVSEGRKATNHPSTVNRPSADLIGWQVVVVVRRRVIEHRQVVATLLLVVLHATQGTDEFALHRPEFLGRP